MIENDDQQRITELQRKQLMVGRMRLEDSKDFTAIVKRMMLDAIDSQINTLTQELEDYAQRKRDTI